MNKKLVSGLAVAVAVATGGMVADSHFATQKAEEALKELVAKADARGVDLTYGDVSASFIRKAVEVKDIVAERRDDATVTNIETLTIDSPAYENGLMEADQINIENLTALQTIDDESGELTLQGGQLSNFIYGEEAGKLNIDQLKLNNIEASAEDKTAVSAMTFSSELISFEHLGMDQESAEFTLGGYDIRDIAVELNSEDLGNAGLSLTESRFDIDAGNGRYQINGMQAYADTMMLAPFHPYLAAMLNATEVDKLTFNLSGDSSFTAENEIQDSYTAAFEGLTEFGFSASYKDETSPIIKNDEHITIPFTYLEDEDLDASLAGMKLDDVEVSLQMRGLLELIDKLNDGTETRMDFAQQLKTQIATNRDDVPGLADAVYNLLTLKNDKLVLTLDAKGESMQNLLETQGKSVDIAVTNG